MRRACVIAMVGATLTAGWPVAAAPVAPAREVRPPRGTVARQLRLKMDLRAAAEGMSLAATMRHNRAEWESLSGDERDSYRQRVLAFLDRSPQQQQQLLKNYDEMIKLTVAQRQEYRQRARWLTAVVATFSEQQRQDMLAMSPKDRAQMLVQRRDELVASGLLKLEPSTQATSAPTTTSAPAN